MMMPYDKDEMLMGWYNYDTECYDYLTGLPEDFTSYIPNIPAARNMYSRLVRMGESPVEAAKNVLTACVGEKN